MDKNKLEIEYEYNFSYFFFIIQNIFIELILIFVAIDMFEKKLSSYKDYFIFFFLVLIIVFIFLEYIKSFFTMKDIVFLDDNIVINSKIFKLEDIECIDRTDRNATRIILKDKSTNKYLVTVFFEGLISGNMLNISYYTFTKIFESEFSGEQNLEKKLNAVKNINLEQEKIENDIFDKGWYLYYLFMIVPVSIILYLMVSSS
ncbi:hypothetical protein [Halarcobacter sp.]|uniref:hypothetical protein n=1 Tax=Halarcobacter sp. TaxID=2321133 RepID=UPI0029F54B37|nr:hypothetical protein [Halarcobacter sp.]